ncbi:DUF349 domain-containing protein [Ulvibacter litoralis]|uniref:Chromosome segregation protein n=1 Tax=Ulvibacter litoralis TaxID=227084 RepID=A0A1G7EPT1_9FLAO|nr:DUF349 domain-containing protein [Ulvibacter litoralis]GHC54306.1 hypothetical protein GCM10008083_18130 [Ulvibacter litoralis]SDE65710.1 protein of unknown function [Ulvibacter litoralis]
MSDENSNKAEEIEKTSEENKKAENLVTETPSETEVEATPSEAPITASEKKEETPKEAVDPSETDTATTEVTDTSEETIEDEEEVASSDDEESDDDIEEKAQKDYHTLTPKQLITELETLLKTKSIQELKHDVEEIRTEFNAKFQDELEHKKEEFLAEGGNIIDFHYSTPDKKTFNSLYFDYKEKRNSHYKNLKMDLQANLDKRNELIEELKGLLNAEENINTTYKHFKEIQEKWHVAGAIPRDKYNIVWNTYHHHVENFYDFLHLNREFRDLDFKHNLEQKLKLIVRANELAQEADVNKAFRELQMLHKMWKEDIGPVAKEYRDDVWDKFSEATKVIHDKRFELLKEEEASYDKNYEAKKELIAKIKEVVSTTKPSHQGWQNAIKKVQELRDAYFETGKVPRAKNKEIWNEFKEATRLFNHEKNSFYKNQKKEQYTNLEKKRELIKIAEENKDSDDFETVTPLMKKIQNDWRKIGHVPRKDSDKIWKKFKASCNHYFDRINAQKNEANKEEMANYDTKKAFLENLSSFELTGDHKTDITNIKGKISEWKELGRVPYNKKSIEQDFNKALDGLFGKLDLGKKESELIKFENKLNSMVSQEDDRKLQNEQFFISKKIEESKNEIRQLENNLGFFQNVDSNNPLVKDVHTNIARHKEQLEVWKAKLSKIRAARQ